VLWRNGELGRRAGALTSNALGATLLYRLADGRKWQELSLALLVQETARAGTEFVLATSDFATRCCHSSLEPGSEDMETIRQEHVDCGGSSSHKPPEVGVCPKKR
jgi:hypothetical protein